MGREAWHLFELLTAKQKSGCVECCLILADQNSPWRFLQTVTLRYANGSNGVARLIPCTGLVPLENPHCQAQQRGTQSASKQGAQFCDHDRISSVAGRLK